MTSLLVLAVLVALGTLPWFLTLAANIKLVRAVPHLPPGIDRPPARWPSVSVVVPACNEAPHIEAALRTLLEQDYPELEVVVVDDRSTDGTGEIVDRLAREDPRVRALHVRALPEGWLGKVHALDVGVKASRGDLVLFTDADVRFGRDTLRRAVARMEDRQLAHLTMIPDLQSTSVVVDLCIAAALRAIAISQRPWHAANPERPEAIGSGGFNMVRRAALLATPGLEWLRLEVADDLGLGLLMKRAGGRMEVLLATGDLQVPWYDTLAQVFRGLEKNGFAQVARYSLARGLLFPPVVMFSACAPFLALVIPGVPWLWPVGAAALVAHVTNALVLHRALGFSLPALLLSAPCGDVLIAAVVLRATVLGVRRGGLIWRGTTYPTALLRDGVRVRF